MNESLVLTSSNMVNYISKLAGIMAGVMLIGSTAYSDSLPTPTSMYNSTRHKLNTPYIGQLNSNDISLRIDKETEPNKLAYMSLYKGSTEILETKVNIGVGVVEKDGRIWNWETRKGLYYIPGILHEPIWYPPSWSSKKGPQPSSDDGPLGAWMMPLLEKKASRKHDNMEYPSNWKNYDTLMRVHAAQEDQLDRLGERLSHGCVRVHPEIIEKIGRALTKNEEFQQTFRGKYHHFEKPVFIKITE